MCTNGYTLPYAKPYMNPSIKQVFTDIVDATASGSMPCKIAITMGYWDEPFDDVIQGTATLG
jgi:hypothetical protein